MPTQPARCGVTNTPGPFIHNVCCDDGPSVYAAATRSHAFAQSLARFLEKRPGTGLRPRIEAAQLLDVERHHHRRDGHQGRMSRHRHHEPDRHPRTGRHQHRHQVVCRCPPKVLPYAAAGTPRASCNRAAIPHHSSAGTALPMFESLPGSACNDLRDWDPRLSRGEGERLLVR